jgi:hypothetical protein
VGDFRYKCSDTKGFRVVQVILTLTIVLNVLQVFFQDLLQNPVKKGKKKVESDSEIE